MTTWNTPNLATPPAVATAQEAFDKTSLDWAATKGEIEDAERAIVEAEAADIKAMADAYGEGTEVEDPDARRREAAAKVPPLKARLKALELATDTAGNALADAIAEARADWLAELESNGDAAAQRYADALAEARLALTELGLAQSTLEWVQNFNPSDARVGMQTQFHGKPRVRVQGEQYGALSGELDPAALLQIAAKVTFAKPKAKATA